MKQTLALFLLLIAAPSYAQQPSSLAALHPRPQVSYFLTGDTGFVLNSKIEIITQQQPSPAAVLAIHYLQSELRRLTGDTLVVLPESKYDFNGNAIFVGEKNWSIIQQGESNSKWDSISHNEGYILDISKSVVMIAGDDTTGTFNGVSTFVQLLEMFKDTVPALHVHDWPDYPIRWVFSTHNLIEQSQITDLEAIEDSMAAHKLNGLQQNDFKNNIYSVFEGSYPQYFYNVDSLQAYSTKTKVELIPGVFPMGWSEGILFHDPDLAEGIPTTTSFLIQSDTGILLTDPNMILPNGGFENVSNGQFTGWSYYDAPGVSTFVDSTTVHSGKYSARCTNLTGANYRFERSMNCQTFHGYHISVWIKTQGFAGSEVQLLALGTDGKNTQGLTATQYSVSATQDWTKYDVVFNTLNWSQVYVYAGVWGGTAGTIWFDDFQVEDAGLTNLLRRKSEMPVVTVAGKSTSYVEGRDYATVIDSVMEENEGSYPWHSSPGFTILPGSTIKNGDTVQVHFIRPNPVINSANGDGSTMTCVSEDTLYSILQDQLSLVDAQYHAGKYFMSHDEIREMNWDTACTSRHLSPAALLADNVIKCDSILKEVHPGCERFDWSDMFDSLHNAHNNYYLDNGDLTGDWNLIPKDFTIVNWNGIVPNDSFPNVNLRKQSLNFFSNLGFSQITSPYYDDQSTKNIRAWRDSMEGVSNIRGMMYTTWANDFSFLTPFADYAWSAGPMIVHKPFDSTSQIKSGDYVDFQANVFPDPYDATDSIVKVWYTGYFHENGQNRTTMVTLNPQGNNAYLGNAVVQGDSGTDVTYEIKATNLQGLTRSTPRYLILHIPGSSGVLANQDSKPINIYPNPALTTITVTAKITGKTTIIIEDLLGREVARFETSLQSSTLDIHDIPAGIYECVITDASGFRNVLPFAKE